MARIAFVSTMGGGPWGGSEELWSRAARHLIESGHVVGASVFNWGALPQQLVELHSAGLVIHRRARGKRLRAIIARLRFGDWNGAALSWLTSFRPDLVVISQGEALDGVPIMDGCRAKGWGYAPIAQLISEGGWPNDLAADAGREAYQGARKSFFVARHNLASLQDQFGVKLDNSEVVSNPFLVPYSPSVPPVKPGNVLRLASVARLDPSNKGQDVLFRVLAQPQWRARPVELRLYGSGRCERSLRRLADMMNLDKVHFCGHVENVESIWQGNDALVLASRCEGTPLVLIEAMLCSRAAIVTDVGGNAELVEDDVSGFVADAPTVGALSGAFERAWQRRADLGAMGLAARSRVISLVPQDPGRYFADAIQRLL